MKWFGRREKRAAVPRVTVPTWKLFYQQYVAANPNARILEARDAWLKQRRIARRAQAAG